MIHQHAILTEPNAKLTSLRFNMDVGSARCSSLAQDIVDGFDGVIFRKGRRLRFCVLKRLIVSVDFGVCLRCR